MLSCLPSPLVFIVIFLSSSTHSSLWSSTLPNTVVSYFSPQKKMKSFFFTIIIVCLVVQLQSNWPKPILVATEYKPNTIQADFLLLITISIINNHLWIQAWIHNYLTDVHECQIIQQNSSILHLLSRCETPLLFNVLQSSPPGQFRLS